MSRRLPWLSLLCCAALSACGHVVHSAPLAEGFTAFLVRGRPDVRLVGVWRSQGYGYVLNIGPQSVDVYDEAGALCWRDPAVAEALAGEISGVRIEDGGRSAVFVSAIDGTQIRADRLEQMPAPCRTAAKADAALVFDAFSATMDQHYAFFDRHGVDWKQRQARLRPLALAAAGDGALFEILLQALDGIDDPHLSLRGEIDGRARRRSFGKTPTLSALRPGFEAQKRLPTTSAYYHAWNEADFARIKAELLGGKAQAELGGNLLWGRTADGVGYLALRSLQGFGRNGDTARDPALLAASLDRAIADLQGAPVLILDLAANLGGSDGAARLVASRFADRARPAYAKQARGAPDAAMQRFDVAPDGPLRFSGPVYVLTSDLTVSAAEVLVLSMRVLPQVTHVGATTRGAFSNVLEKTLPNGWGLGLSNETYVDADGRCFEGKGLAPGIELAVFKPERIDDGHLDALKTLLGEIRARGSNSASTTGS